MGHIKVLKNLLRALSVGALWVGLNAQAASLIAQYDDKGHQVGISGITGIVEESSWRCKRDDSLLCACSTVLLVGTVAEVAYQRQSAIPEGLVLETAKGAEHLHLGTNWHEGLGEAALSWVPKLFIKGSELLVAADRCGANGSNVVARDIYSTKHLPANAPNKLAQSESRATARSSYSAKVAPLTAKGESSMAESTYDRARRKLNAGADAISAEAGAYSSDKMSPKEKANFEQRIRLGEVVVPEQMRPRAQHPSGIMVGPKTLQAYRTGTMQPQQRAEFEALVKSGELVLPDGISLEDARSNLPTAPQPKRN